MMVYRLLNHISYTIIYVPRCELLKLKIGGTCMKSDGKNLFEIMCITLLTILQQYTIIGNLKRLLLLYALIMDIEILTWNNDNNIGGIFSFNYCKTKIAYKIPIGPSAYSYTYYTININYTYWRVPITYL